MQGRGRNAGAWYLGCTGGRYRRMEGRKNAYPVPGFNELSGTFINFPEGANSMIFIPCISGGFARSGDTLVTAYRTGRGIPPSEHRGRMLEIFGSFSMSLEDGEPRIAVTDVGWRKLKNSAKLLSGAGYTHLTEVYTAERFFSLDEPGRETYLLCLKDAYGQLLESMRRNPSKKTLGDYQRLMDLLGAASKDSIRAISYSAMEIAESIRRDAPPEAASGKNHPYGLS